MRGMSLIEVLVALVILSVGLLGIAQVLIHGMRVSHAALLRTHAVNLVADMSDRIRANPYEDHLAEWLESVRAVLPASSGEVSHSAADGLDHFHVTVSWVEPGEPQALTEYADVVLVTR
jgi:prepilin-type N-terminal cleavage/methylation domain-containing protein